MNGLDVVTVDDAGAVFFNCLLITETVVDVMRLCFNGLCLVVIIFVIFRYVEPLYRVLRSFGGGRK